MARTNTSRACCRATSLTNRDRLRRHRRVYSLCSAQRWARRAERKRGAPRKLNPMLPRGRTVLRVMRVRSRLGTRPRSRRRPRAMQTRSLPMSRARRRLAPIAVHPPRRLNPPLLPTHPRRSSQPRVPTSPPTLRRAPPPLPGPKPSRVLIPTGTLPSRRSQRLRT